MALVCNGYMLAGRSRDGLRRCPHQKSMGAPVGSVTVAYDPVIPPKNCSSAGTVQNLLPHGGGVQLGGEVVFAVQWVGNEAQGNAGGGLFYDESSGLSDGGFAT